jgi:hypothetical protein
LEKQVKRDKEMQPMRTKCDRPIDEGEKLSTGFPDGRGSSNLTMDQRVKLIDRWPNRRICADGRKKAILKKIRQKESTVEAGQSTIGKRSKSEFREILTPARVLF